MPLKSEVSCEFLDSLRHLSLISTDGPFQSQIVFVAIGSLQFQDIAGQNQLLVSISPSLWIVLPSHPLPPPLPKTPSSSASPLLSPFGPLACPVVLLYCSDLPWMTQSSAPPWCVDASATPLASDPWTPPWLCAPSAPPWSVIPQAPPGSLSIQLHLGQS